MIRGRGITITNGKVVKFYMDGNSPPVLDIWPIIDFFATSFEKALPIFGICMILFIIGVSSFFAVCFIKAGRS